MRDEKDTAHSQMSLEEAKKLLKGIRQQVEPVPLTLEQLREMDGKPVFLPETDCWALVTTHVFVALLTFPDGEKCSANDWYEQVGPVYACPPAQIDRKALKPCYDCTSCGNCQEAGKATGESINYAHPCHSCVDGNHFKPVAFCRICGYPLTDEAWAKFQKHIERIGGAV